MSKNTWKGNYGIIMKIKIKTKPTNKNWLTKLNL